MRITINVTDWIQRSWLNKNVAKSSENSRASFSLMVEEQEVSSSTILLLWRGITCSYQNADPLSNLRRAETRAGCGRGELKAAINFRRQTVRLNQRPLPIVVRAAKIFKRSGDGHGAKTRQRDLPRAEKGPTLCIAPPVDKETHSLARLFFVPYSRLHKLIHFFFAVYKTSTRSSNLLLLHI